MPLLALPFLLLFVYVGAQFTKEDTSKKDKPKELSLSLGETRDSIMTKNDAYDAFFKKDDNRTMLGGLDKEEDSLLSYEDQLSLDQKRKIDSLKAVSSRQNQQASKGGNSSYYNPKQQNEDKDFKRSSEIIRMLNDKSNGKQENEQLSENQKSSNQNAQQDPVKYLKQQMLVMDSLEKARDPEYQAKLLAEQKLKANKEKMDEFLNSTFNVGKSGINSEFNAFYRENENSFIKAVIDENNKGFLEAESGSDYWKTSSSATEKLRKAPSFTGKSRDFPCSGLTSRLSRYLPREKFFPSTFPSMISTV